MPAPRLDHHRPRASPGNDSLLSLNRRQKFLGFFAGGKAANLAIVGIVLGRIGRAKHDKFASIGFDKYRQIVTVNGSGERRNTDNRRHTCTTNRRTNPYHSDSRCNG